MESSTLTFTRYFKPYAANGGNGPVVAKMYGIFSTLTYSSHSTASAAESGKGLLTSNIKNDFLSNYNHLHIHIFLYT